MDSDAQNDTTGQGLQSIKISASEKMIVGCRSDFTEITSLSLHIFPGFPSLSWHNRRNRQQFLSQLLWLWFRRLWFPNRIPDTSSFSWDFLWFTTQESPRPSEWFSWTNRNQKGKSRLPESCSFGIGLGIYVESGWGSFLRWRVRGF
jgi:hypothetical protein